VTLIALSAAYGAGGSVIGPALAQRFGVPFVDRAIPMAVAERLDVSIDDAAAHDEQASASWLERVLRGFAGGDPGAPTPLPAETFFAEDFRRATEEVLLQQAATGEGVILGRGAVMLLRDDPRVVRVRLDGPPERRVRQARQINRGLDLRTAERTVRQLDRTHEAYAQQFYGVSVRDPSLYHLMLDSTAIGLDACVEVIALAARSLAARAREPVVNGSAPNGPPS
jgi:cytidylate kinase